MFGGMCALILSFRHTCMLLCYRDDPITIQLTGLFAYTGRMYTFMSDFTFLLVVRVCGVGLLLGIAVG